MGNMTIEEYKRIMKGSQRPKYGNRKVYYNQYTNERYDSAVFKSMLKKKKIKNKEKFIKFDSIMECDYYKDLLLLERCGEVKHIELQPRFTLVPKFKKNGMTIRAITYKADFKVCYSDKESEIIDVKGNVTEAFKIKWKLFEYKYPDLKLKVVDKEGREMLLQKPRKKTL